jgi:predicted amino acid racemase
LTAEVIEVKWKPALPHQRESGHAVLEEHPIREDQALRCRAIVAVGTQDVRIEGLSPRTAGMRIIGASSDHLVLDVTARPVKVGDKLEFALKYPALMTAMASPYVRKEILPRGNDNDTT